MRLRMRPQQRRAERGRAAGVVGTAGPVGLKPMHPWTFFFFLFFCFFRATPTTYGGSQARGLIRATSASLHHSHSNAGSELHHLRAIPQPRQRWILNPLSETKDRTHNLMVPSRIRFTNGNSPLGFLIGSALKLPPHLSFVKVGFYYLQVENPD